MKRLIRTLLFIFPVFGMYSCTSLLPVNSQFEQGGTLKKDHVEVMGNYSRYDQSGFGRVEKTNDQYGFRIGYGMTDRFDLKFRYEHLVFSQKFDYTLQRANYFGLVPKIAMIPDRMAFLMPVGFYYLKRSTDIAGYREQVMSIAPQMVFTLEPIKNKLDFSVGGKVEMLINNKASNFYFGSNIGLGISSDLSKWAIRPEFGLSTDAGDYRFRNFGIAFQYKLFAKRR